MTTCQHANVIPDSCLLTDSCRLLANALVNPKNKDSQYPLSLIMKNQLVSLERALLQPVPEDWKDLNKPANDDLFDFTELESDELCDQCIALNYALLTLHDEKIKDILAFILWERIEKLRWSLNVPGEVSL